MSSEAAGSLLKLRVLTPEGAVLEGEVSEVTLPGSEGELGILPQHAACLTRLSPGTLSYHSPEGDDTIALGKGAAEIRENKVTVLVNLAVLREAIDTNALEARRKKILAELDGRDLSEEKVVSLEEELLLTDVQLQVARQGPSDIS